MVKLQNNCPEVLLLSSSDGAHTGRSGYNILSDYLSNAKHIQVNRISAKNLIQRFADGIFNRAAVTNWYRRSSIILEYKALKAIKSGSFQIVHFLWGDKDFGFLYLVKKKYNFKICCTIHNCQSMLPEIFNYPARLKNIDAFILMSATQKNYFINIGISPDKLHVVKHGIDTEFFSPGLSEERSKQFTVLTVGSWQRDFTVLREICVKLASEPKINIKVVSSEKYKHYFDDLQNVTFRTGLTDLELLETYRASSCFLLTLKDSTANNALLEALSCGLPIVSERIGGIPEYVNDKCAILCSRNNIDEIVNSIFKVWGCENLRNDMSHAARQRAEELNWVNSIKQLDAIYNSLVNG